MPGVCWQCCSSTIHFPDKLVRVGVDSDGCQIFAGRAFHEGDFVPAKVIPSKHAVSISYGGEEVFKQDFEVMKAGEYVWEFSVGGEVPSGAVPVGVTADGETLYMGRALYQGTQTPGKVQPSHGCLYIPFNGEEISISEYEVLCTK